MTAKNLKTVVIKKYAIRRLYNTATSTYTTLEDLATMTREGVDFQVIDVKTGEDITRSILIQIILEQERKRDPNLLPITFLRQLIRFYGSTMQASVQFFLESSINFLINHQREHTNSPKET